MNTLFTKGNVAAGIALSTVKMHTSFQVHMESNQRRGKIQSYSKNDKIVYRTNFKTACSR